MTVSQISKMICELRSEIAVTLTYDGYARLESYNRSNICAQSYSYNGLGDRVRVVKPTGTRNYMIIRAVWSREAQLNERSEDNTALRQ